MDTEYRHERRMELLPPAGHINLFAIELLDMLPRTEINS